MVLAQRGECRGVDSEVLRCCWRTGASGED